MLIIAVCAVLEQPMLALGAVVVTSFLSFGLRAFFVWKATRQSTKGLPARGQCDDIRTTVQRPVAWLEERWWRIPKP